MVVVLFVAGLVLAAAQPSAAVRSTTVGFRWQLRHLLTERQLQCSRGNGYYVMPGSGCREYFRCHAWLARRYKIWRFHCAPGTLFSERLSVCVWPSLQRRIDGEGSCRSPILPACPDIGFYMIPNDCTKFLRCGRAPNGTIVGTKYDCPKGTLFNAKIPVCDDPNNMPHDIRCRNFRRRSG